MQCSGVPETFAISFAAKRCAKSRQPFGCVHAISFIKFNLNSFIHDLNLLGLICFGSVRIFFQRAQVRVKWKKTKHFRLNTLFDQRRFADLEIALTCRINEWNICCLYSPIEGLQVVQVVYRTYEGFYLFPCQVAECLQRRSGLEMCVLNDRLLLWWLWWEERTCLIPEVSFKCFWTSLLVFNMIQSLVFCLFHLISYCVRCLWHSPGATPNSWHPLPVTEHLQRSFEIWESYGNGPTFREIGGWWNIILRPESLEGIARATASVFCQELSAVVVSESKKWSVSMSALLRLLWDIKLLVVGMCSRR